MCWITAAISLKDSTRQMIRHFRENKFSAITYIFISLLSVKDMHSVEIQELFW